MKKSILSAILISTLILYPCVTFGATIHVPADQETIQVGINAAVDGDLVLVSPGTYVENIDFLGKAITIQSEAGAGVTIIDGNQNGPVVKLKNVETGTATLNGLTIRNGYDYQGAGIYCSYSSLTITNCMISGNSTTDDGGGIYSRESNLIITNCLITRNSSGSQGGGIFFYRGSGIITNCAIWENNTYRCGGGIYNTGASLEITNCLIRKNTNSIGYGGGIYGGFTVTNCAFTENSAVRGGGIYVSRYDDAFITNCTISDNSASEQGGGIFCSYRTDSSMTNCILWRDSAAEGTEIYLEEWGYDTATLAVSYCDVQGGEVAAFVETGCTLDWLEGNIDVDPLFLEGGNYLLSEGSPCIDAGNPESCYIDTSFPPSMGTERNDVGAYGGHPACGWCGDHDGDGHDPEVCGGTDCNDIYLYTYPGAEEICDGVDNDCDGIVPDDESVDADGDSWVLCTDCNDAIPEINPGVEEVCDATDWDCSGDPHDRDSDRDGYIDDDPVCAGDDCDDSDPVVYPGAPEACDGKDNDCDGTAPDEEDEDGDEWMICEEDCDDTDPEIYPGHPEIVGNGKDDDCDGEIDEPFSTFHVPCDQPTIQAGIDKAYEGDLVLVTPGLYRENIDFHGKSITLRSERGPIQTIIDGGRSGSVVVFESIWAEGAVIEGFKIHNGYAHHGGGIYCKSSSPTIMNCVITDNFTDENGSGGGIYCYSSSSPSIVDCSILRNNATFAAGIYCRGSSQTITNCTISGNSASRDGGGIYCSESSATITDCMISSNSASYGGGIRCYESSPTIMNCAIFNNEAAYNGGGIQCTDRSKPTIENCTIWGNSAPSGGGIFCEGSYTAPTIMSCSIWGNSALSGGGIKSSVFSSPTIINCAVWGNYAIAGAGLYCWRSSLVVRNSTIRGNVAFNGGGMACSGCDPTEITNSIFWGDLALIGHELWVGRSGYPSRVTVSYSDVQGGEAAAYVSPYSTLTWLEGNIHRLPHFVGLFDHHLQPGSPCIDAGTDAGVYTDRDGDERPQGDGFDMGADEFVPAGICFIGTLL